MKLSVGACLYTALICLLSGVSNSGYTETESCRSPGRPDDWAALLISAKNVWCPIERPLHDSLATWRLAPVQLMRDLPRDPDRTNRVRQVPRAVFSDCAPTALSSPVRLAGFWPEVLDLLDMTPDIADTDEFLQVVSGNSILPWSTPLAHRYGGHQFSSWAGQLGDGRAHLLGEYVNSLGERWQLQLKGSGKTPYSRRGDGRAVVRSSVREFLASEAMYHLGVGTSRAVTLVVGTKPTVLRDQFYDGHPVAENPAVVLRMAPTWFRIGSLEILAQQREIDILRILVDFIIKEHFYDIDLQSESRYFEFYTDVINRTALMVAQWQSVGFAHGVCNTDNFSVLGITIDYGPFGFMEGYDPDMIPNTSDDEGMYSYKRQPAVAAFNLDKLRLALLPLIPRDQHRIMAAILDGYSDVYRQHYRKMFNNKLGFKSEHKLNEKLLEKFFKMMADTHCDFTMTFRQLGDWEWVDIEECIVPKELWALHQLTSHVIFASWCQMYKSELETSGDVQDNFRRLRIHAVSPRYVLRNWMAQQAISGTETGDDSVLHRLQRVLRRPYAEQDEAEHAGYADPTPAWANSVKVSCSS